MESLIECCGLAGIIRAVGNDHPPLDPHPDPAEVCQQRVEPDTLVWSQHGSNAGLGRFGLGEDRVDALSLRVREVESAGAALTGAVVRAVAYNPSFGRFTTLVAKSKISSDTPAIAWYRRLRTRMPMAPTTKAASRYVATQGPTSFTM